MSTRVSIILLGILVAFSPCFLAQNLPASEVPSQELKNILQSTGVINVPVRRQGRFGYLMGAVASITLVLSFIGVFAFRSQPKKLKVTLKPSIRNPKLPG